MKYLRQFAIILAVTCAGEILHYFIPLPVPGSIYGLVLMFLLLSLRILPVAEVKETALFLIEIMPVMFIPPAVGLLDTWGILGPIVVPVGVISVVSTILVMVVTGLVAQGVMRLTEKQPERNRDHE